jgi:hypothetical protein
MDRDSGWRWTGTAADFSDAEYLSGFLLRSLEDLLLGFPELVPRFLSQLISRFVQF